MKDHGSCPICEEEPGSTNAKTKPRFYLGVIDRKTQTFKILDISMGVLRDIKKLHSNPKWGPLVGYDIDIIKNPNSASPADYYTVQPVPKEALTPNDQKIIEELDLSILEKMVATPTPQKVAEKVEAYKTRLTQPKQKPGSNQRPAAVVVKKKTVVEVEEEDDFPVL
jgi:hypothetical protein